MVFERYDLSHGLPVPLGWPMVPWCPESLRAVQPQYAESETVDDVCAQGPVKAITRRQCGRGSLADIFREVDEEVRSERAKELWRKYGAFVIGAAVLAVLAVGGFQLWNHLQAEAAAEASLRLEEAAVQADGEKPADAAAAFAALAAEGGGAGLLARFGEAAELARQGGIEAALARYEALAADEDTDPVYRDLARLFQGMTELDAGRPEAAIAALEGLSGALRYSAAETIAAAHAALGDRTAAVAGFKALADDAAAPVGVRRRSAEMLAALGEAS